MYFDILDNNLIPSADLLRNGQDFIFQHDNAPCHRATTVTDWFKEQSDRNIEILQWPANSPDLNPIENIWAWLDKQLAKVEPKSLEELEAAIKAALDSIPLDMIRNLYILMPERMKLCINAKGGATRY